MTQTLAHASASELLNHYRHGRVSPTEAVSVVLDQIERLNPHINAYRFIDRDAALAAARQSEARWLAGQPQGLLDGVPVSVKDLLLTRGWSTLRGSLTVNPTQSWDTDAPAVARLREHGAVLLGKTTTPEFGCKGVTDSFLTGVTRNPWNLEYSPGGSSGGAAAAVAAGMGPLALGTDGAGSIRIPSAFSGVVGLKPSFGRVPAWPPSPFGSLAHVGPHTRTVDDAALLLTVISGPDGRDWTSLPYQPRDYRVGLEKGVFGLRIAYSPTLGYAKVHPDVAAAVRECAGLLSELGAQVEEVDPGFSDPLDLICGFWFLGAATLYTQLAPELRGRLDPFLQWQAAEGAKFGAVEINQMNIRRAELGSQMRQFHRRYDLLLTPAVAVPALPARPTDAPFDARPEDFLGWTPFSYPFNLTQQPAGVIPCGLSREGLPVAAQLVGPMHDDAMVLRALRSLESALPPLPWPAMAGI